MALIRFFEAFRLRHSQFPLVTRKSSLPTNLNETDPPKQVCAQFKPKNKFEMPTPNVSFDFTKEVISITIDNKIEEENITIFRHTTLVFSEILLELVIRKKQFIVCLNHCQWQPKTTNTI